MSSIIERKENSVNDFDFFRIIGIMGCTKKQTIGLKKMKDIKLIAIDLDGTWLRSDCSISEHTKKAVIRAIEAGYLVVPTTGRSYRNARAVLQDIPGLRYFINANGATVADAKEQKMIYAETIPYEISSQVFGYARQYDCFMELYEGFDAYVDQAGKEYLAGIGLSEDYIEQLMSTNIQQENLDVFMNDPQRKISKFHIVCSSEETKDELKDKIASLTNCYPGKRTMGQGWRPFEAGRASRVVCEEYHGDRGQQQRFGYAQMGGHFRCDGKCTESYERTGGLCDSRE